MGLCSSSSRGSIQSSWVGDNPSAIFYCSGGVEGKFEVELFMDRTPLTASNFIDLAQSGFYTGIHFHRVIESFMCQAGTLSMANTGRPNSGGSQFFINVNNNSNLDWWTGGSSKHPVFGRVTKNYDLVVKISNVATNQSDSPKTPVRVDRIEISGA
eukprot:g1953.t1